MVDEAHHLGDQGVAGLGGDEAVHLLADGAVVGVALGRGSKLEHVHRLAHVELDDIPDAVRQRDGVGSLGREATDAELGALAEAWSALMETAGLSRVRRINRDYLLRPVAWHGHSFHPKTYLFGNENSGALLVGSGNADLQGI